MTELDLGENEDNLSERKKDITLQIHQARDSDVFKDIIRIHEKEIKRRKLQDCKHNLVSLTYKNRKRTAWLRTLEPRDFEKFRENQQKKISARDKARFEKHHKKGVIKNPDHWILMDEKLRDFFNVTHLQSYDLRIVEAGLLERISFYSRHSDPVIRFSFRLAFLSLIISIIALLLGII